MPNRNRDNDKPIKKDQQIRREVQKEVGEEIRSGRTSPLVRQPNRDQARGDWDRTGDHQDVDASRAPDDEEDVDKGA